MGNVVSKVITFQRVIDVFRSDLIEVLCNDLQKPKQENPRQRNLLPPIRPQRPNHRHRQAQDHDISNKVTDTGTDGEGDGAHAMCRLRMPIIPEGIYWHALKDVGEEDCNPPSDDDDAGGVDGYSKATRWREETIIEQK